MFSSLFNTSRKRRKTRHDRSPFASTYADDVTSPERERSRRSQRYYDHVEDYSTGDDDLEDAEDEDEDSENSTEEGSPLLPIFDSSHLDTLPVYNLTHTIRLLVVSRCETVLSWEQLRSPQVSQFLLKPIQQEIRTNYFSAATIYALMANCLQFTKEVATHPGNSGTSGTRAMICELVAIKLLREYTTRGLIDVLSYDFDPLQGQMEAAAEAQSPDLRASWQASRKSQPKSVRISCFEIAIRAQAKRFLAHPLVVQQLEAIWDGSIVFHAAADSLHRVSPATRHVPTYGTNAPLPAQQERKLNKSPNALPRRLVTLYDPRDASLFKLSRLRVPRYRNFLSTMSFAVLLGLFLAVLVERSLEISALEVIFWFWAAGYMLDEIVGFNEQGFGLYIASFWNTFDLGILLLLFVHLCLRMYGILMVDVHKNTIANTAYDILAADAILLFPRLFSVLDHYRYFSQLIIAFRMMAADLMAVFILIVISCSGFFVALSLSFNAGVPDDPYDVAYALLQMLMGFTPAAWDRWNSYTVLGRAILTLFLFICHFLVVTILITVLTNSFMAVVRNANEEHQFLFAVNTISNVKSDTLFSYVAPFNVLQWLLTPLRYVLPFRQFVKVNRTVIKITHFPVLFTIYFYEKTILQPTVVDRIDLVKTYPKTRRTLSPNFTRLRRERSVATLRQDEALEEVFKQPFESTMRTGIGQNPRQTSGVVSKWMKDMDTSVASPPQEQDPGVVDQLERRRGSRRGFSAISRSRHVSRRAMSVVSDPADLVSIAGYFSPGARMPSASNTTPTPLELTSQQEDADGDDELLTADNDDDDGMSDGRHARTNTRTGLYGPARSYFRPPLTRSGSSRQEAGIPGLPAKLTRNDVAASSMGSISKVDTQKRSGNHLRNASSTTMIYNPPIGLDTGEPSSQSQENKRPAHLDDIPSTPGTPRSKQASSGTGRKTPKPKHPPQLRPMLPGKEDAMFRSTPNLQNLRPFPNKQQAHKPSVEMDLVSDIGDNKALGGGYVGAIPASFAAQLALASGSLRQQQKERQDEQEMLSRVMMARMNSLEEGFRDVIHEVRESIKSTAPSSRRSRSVERAPKTPTQAQRDRKKGKEKMKSAGASGAEEKSNTGGSTAEEDKRTNLLSVATKNSIQMTLDTHQSSEASVPVDTSKAHEDN